MKSPRAYVIAFLCGVGALAVVLLFRRGGAAATSTSAGGSAATASQPAHTSIVTPDADRTSVTVAETSADSESTVFVTDAWGKPMAGAFVFDARISREWYEPGDSSMLGVTPADGILRIDVPDGSRSIQVGRPGFLTEALEIAPGARAQVTLVEGGRVRLLCKLKTTGLPLEGVTVCVRSPVKPGYEETREDWPVPAPDAIPSAPVRSVVFRVLTGPDGIASFDGLVPGPLGHYAVADNCVQVDGPGRLYPDTTTIHTGDSTYELGFLPITGCGYRVVGDEVVTSRGDPVQSVQDRGWANGLRECSIKQERLNKEFPGASFCVMPAGLRMDMTLVLREHGRHSFSLAFSPLDELRARGPTVIDASTLPREGTPVENVMVRILNQDEGELRDVPFLLMAGRLEVAKDMLSGVSTLLPHGSYQFMAGQRSITASLDGKQTLLVTSDTPRPDGQIVFELRLNRTLRAVILTHLPVSVSEIVVANRVLDGKHFHIDIGAERERVKAYLEPGEYEFRANETGPIIGRGSVALGDDNSEPIVISLDAGK